MAELILNQTRIPKEKWRYGFRSSAATGCGWIATYNALAILGYRMEPEKLIRAYERQLPIIHGNLGTAFFAPALMFRKWGFPVETSADRKRYDEIGKRSRVCLLFYHWRSGIRLGSHFVALKWENERFVGYNTYRNSAGADIYGSSLAEFLEKQHYFGTFLIGIQQKRK